MSDAVPVFEAKNRLPFYIHKAEEEGPVILSRRNEDVAVIISIEEYKAFLEDRRKARKDLNIVERAKLFRERHKDLYEGDDFDKTIDQIFNHLRDGQPSSYDKEKHVWDEVLEDWND